MSNLRYYLLTGRTSIETLDLIERASKGMLTSERWEDRMGGLVALTVSRPRKKSSSGFSTLTVLDVLVLRFLECKAVCLCIRTNN